MPRNEASGPDYGILVHCHLRWDFVWQRPQHILSRLSEFHPIIFLEDALPIPEGETEPRLAITHVSPTLTTARPLLEPRTGDPEKDRVIDAKNGQIWRRLLDTLVRSQGWKHLVHWFYTPMAVGARSMYAPIAVVYDCMDELANFKGAPANIKELEGELMAAADVVFTGGPSMYAARKDRHPRVYQFNSGVDVAHFQKALSADTDVPADMAALPGPRLLYYGVIDERMGWDNLEAVADAHPEWSIVMVGPLAKITEDDLLRRANIHYLGQRGYDDLPGYLKGCDVALVPFALSDATRYLSPTKTLEYFAARKPVVSTPILDIVEHYADAAHIASTPAAFVAACEAVLREREGNGDAARLDRGEAHAQGQTWDRIVADMRGILDNAVAENLAALEAEQESGEEAPRSSGIATGQVRWYSGSRGVGVVETDSGGEVMAFLPGSVQEDLGGVQEGRTVAVTPAGPRHVGDEDEQGTNMFPLDLDKMLGSEKP